jgi:hypothetical protein
MSSDVLALTRGEWLGPIPHDYEAKPEWLADDAIVMVAFNPREHQVAMTWEFAEKRKAPARERDWAAVTAFCVEIPSFRRPTPAGDAVERVARMMNENIEAREIAKQEDADAYDDSEPRVQDYWQALARAAIAAMGGAGWRPIETAPRDGSKIDVWIEDARHTNVFWGRPDHSCGEAGDYCDCCPSYDAWVCADMNDYLTGDEGFACDDPTHWMPLPPSPAAA